VEPSIETALSLHFAIKDPEERSVFSRMDERSAQEFRLSALLCESLTLVEDFLNGGGEFGRVAALKAFFRQGILGKKRLERVNSLCRYLGYEPFELPSADATGSRAVAGVWESLLARLPAAAGTAHPRSEPVALRANTLRGPHLRALTQQISNLFEGFPEDVRAFGYHGSIGSNDHVRWLSDCDAVIILRAGVVTDPARLRMLRPAFLEARRIMKRIDAFQHHGIHVLPEELFACYPEDYFPTVLFQSSSFDIGAGDEVSLRVVASRWFELTRVLGVARYLKQMAPGVSSLNYHMFHFVLQLAQLLPCFVVACCEHSMNKREAIPWLAQRCSPQSKAFLLGTGELRDGWSAIWSSSRIARGLIAKPQERKLREQVCRGLGGRDQLAVSLESLARDCSRIAMGCLRGAGR
jgi:hypothetical protein